MKISFSKDYGSFIFSIDPQNEEQDREKLVKLEKLMSYPEYVDLLELYLAMKEKYDESIMKVKPQEQSFRENAIYASRLNGFWEALQAPQKCMEELQRFRANKKAEISAQIDEVLNTDIIVGQGE